ncbi:flavoprotein NADH-dependent oxidoreductase [Roridomyces roridus]|uniref:Flavoprotein NADH-dependent oxidoreductase n=1 Tax=Roridomyces roridus TaxID=1738132 RepID=A0AAD7BPS9_9AGAR|nr:flavoprotein NADH-dependent oxidoreductase [Roridomyces roridus]
MSSALFTPLKVGSVTVPNRIGMSALTRSRSSASVPNDIMKDYYDQRAAGGAGLIVTEGVLITRQGTEWPNAPGIWNDEQVAGWKKIIDSVHAHGSKIYAQLWHVGRVAHPQAPEQIAAGVPVYAPSAISARGGNFRHIEGAPGYVTPTEVADPTILVALFKQAAVNAKKAGFDGVELHGANGYLIHQFLDSTSNTRTDQWGGSVENRARFALETLKAVIEVFGPDVAIKVNPAGGYNDMGMPLQETLDTYEYLLREADKLNLAYVCLARYSPWLDVEFDGKKRATPHDVPETYAPFLPSTNIWVNTGYTPEEAETAVSSGKIAGVFFGMAWITHPDVGKRIQKGKPLDNAPDYATLYGAPGVDPAKGYTDYKAAEY